MTQPNLQLDLLPSRLPTISSLATSLAHPYARYGLAVALAFHTNGKTLQELTEEQLREALALALESGLNFFRMETKDDPQHQSELRFRPISLERLRAEADLVSGSLAAQGKYLFPSVIASDKQAKGAFADVEKVLSDLRNKAVPIERVIDLKRSIAPIAGEINNGAKEKMNQKGTLFEAACVAIATVTSEKPSAQIGGSNTGIFPDLDIAHLIEFVRVFHQFQSEGSDRLTGKPTKDGKFRRPPLQDGNYPNAPHEASFGAIGLLAAMGYWGNRASETTRKQTGDALRALKERSLYLISYDAQKNHTSNVAQVRFSHHIIEIALTGNLRSILDEFYATSLIYAGMEHGSPIHFEPKGSGVSASELKALYTTYKHFYFATSRFLQRFNAPALRDFLSTRAEYPPSTGRLLGAYFMQVEKISQEVVESVRALGQWINRTAYFVAEENTDKNAQNRAQSVRKAKAKVLVEFESAVMSAVSPEDMLHRVSTRAGRLLQGDAPAEATAYFDAATTSAISFRTAQHLLIAYLRLRTAKTPDLSPSSNHEVPADGAADDDSDLAEKESQ